MFAAAYPELRDVAAVVDTSALAAPGRGRASL